MMRRKFPEVSPFFHRLRRERDQKCAMPLSSVSRSASAFMWATISSSPPVAAVTTAVISPSGPKRGVNISPVSSSWAGAGGDRKEASDMAGSVGAHAHQIEEAGLLLEILAQCAGEGAGQGGGALLADTAHGHAHVLGFDQHGDAARLQHLLDGRSDQ